MSREQDSPASICVTNAKGGTGKTTVAINIAGALNERGHDVLFVDLDPQGNATEGLGLVDAYDSDPPTLFDVLTDATQQDVIEDLIVSHEEMDVVPSHFELLEAEHELTIANAMATVKSDPGIEMDPAGLTSLANLAKPDTIATEPMDHLDLALSVVADDYDYIVIDSPPFYGQLTDTAIYATQNIIIPALTESSSERAIELLFDQVAALEDRTGITVTEVGVVANRVETTNEDKEMLEWFNTVFSDVPVWEVRKRVALQRAFSKGSSVFVAERESDMTDVFLSIAEDLDKQFGFLEEVTA